MYNDCGARVGTVRRLLRPEHRGKAGTLEASRHTGPATPNETHPFRTGFGCDSAPSLEGAAYDAKGRRTGIGTREGIAGLGGRPMTQMRCGTDNAEHSQPLHDRLPKMWFIQLRKRRYCTVLYLYLIIQWKWKRWIYWI